MLQILSLRQIKNRIRSVESTKKLTNAMEMVSVSKLKKIENMLFRFNNYFTKLDSIFNSLIPSCDIKSNLFFRKAKDVKKIALCVITADTGLAGAYNSGVINAAEGFINKQGREKIMLFTVGRKGFSYFRKAGFEVKNLSSLLQGKFSKEACDKITNDLMWQFLKGDCDEVYIAYTVYHSASRRIPEVKKFLNLESDARLEKNYIFEPDPDSMLNKLLYEYIYSKIKFSLLTSFASEHSARVVAMGEATDNAKELLENLILTRNKVRQANVTKEILEIVSSAEALRG